MFFRPHLLDYLINNYQEEGETHTLPLSNIRRKHLFPATVRRQGKGTLPLRMKASWVLPALLLSTPCCFLWGRSRSPPPPAEKQLSLRLLPAPFPTARRRGWGSVHHRKQGRVLRSELLFLLPSASQRRRGPGPGRPCNQEASAPFPWPSSSHGSKGPSTAERAVLSHKEQQKRSKMTREIGTRGTKCFKKTLI